MSRRAAETDDRLDEVLAEIERARHEPAWVPEPTRTPKRLIRPPDALDDARWSPSRPAAAFFAICALIAVAVVAGRWIVTSRDAPASATPSGASTVRVSGSAQIAGATASASASASRPVAGGPVRASTSAGPMSIHVVGAVSHPGVVQVAAGARVEDAVRAAGGLKGADPAGINLARPLSDGEQVHVPRPGETVTNAPVAAGGLGAPSAAGVSGGGGAASGPSGVVNLNTADVAALDSLPGVGPVLAQRILDWRTTNGRFTSVDELGEVSGIGDKALERLRPKVTV